MKEMKGRKVKRVYWFRSSGDNDPEDMLLADEEIDMAHTKAALLRVALKEVKRIGLNLEHGDIVFLTEILEG